MFNSMINDKCVQGINTYHIVRVLNVDCRIDVHPLCCMMI